ncbi:DNA-directed RNA polymerase sigma-70 factor [Sphaerisporangium krabiense]|uniref:RNA polymerase sigma-70 factor (ECF subfamily) n=1 Tax=Sphaerisporangium krabiense TaxID=763782 RepID=A0A7W8Z428_9ACTN|nr:RNA polymerase sigma factor [Sphaerisporangium krabiense]MBB5627089.1 RNA polymerase sigma-70 factor (ECF subfamily) [Sphaerisporangium krabiense]GII65244.1 DNA-directed RNA polymerase sigma-70 factor [Sphaerisporangium krabiense]
MVSAQALLDGSTLDDSTVIARSLGRPEMFAVLFDRHADEIFRYAARRLGPEIAEDVVAEVFLAAFRGRARYDPSRPDARPWLYGIATNVVAHHRGAERRRVRAMAKVAGQRPGSPADAFDERSVERVAAGGLRPRLAQALAGLSAKERDLLLLVAWTDLTYEEVARALEIPVGTVRSRLHRVRAKLRRVLGGSDPLSLESMA